MTSPPRIDKTIALDPSAAVPIYRQLYDRFRDAIAAGKLSPGERVPSVRTLASELGLARGTVQAAYDLLTGEGYFVARGQAGTIVAPQLANLADISPRRPRRTPPPPAPNASFPNDGLLLKLQMGLPALDAFPRKLWSRIGAQNLRALSPAAMAYPDPRGFPPLREAIAAYLQVSRGIACAPEQVFIAPGYRGALDLIGRILLKPGDEVWFEDPGYPLARQALAGMGAKFVPIGVDADGLRVGEGVTKASKARFAVVTPSHQSPLGVSLSLPRRLELIGWAKAAKAWIVEDDYDGEFRYSGRPLPALKSLDRDGRVLYAGTFSKVLFPSLRLAYLVVPEELVGRFDETCRTMQSASPHFVQSTVAEFLQRGHFARHLKKMRGLYARRRAFVADALTERFPKRLRIDLQAGGMHLLARLVTRESDLDLVRLARACGFGFQALSPWAVAHDCGRGLLIGFTNVASPEDAAAMADELARAWMG
jgi:GntR family transcriptional regulator/MocR family aminotransferase